MAISNPTWDALVAQVSQVTTVGGSATALINGIAARIQAAVDAALAGSISAADFTAAVQTEIDALKAATDPLAAAVSANTPAAPPAAKK